MGIIITTDDLLHVAAGDRFGLWEDLVSHNVLNQEIAYNLHEGRIYGAIQTAELAGLLMARVCCTSGQTVARSKARIARDTEDTAILCLQIEGRAVLTTDDENLELDTGDWTLCDCHKPYTWRFTDNHGQLVLKIPKHKLVNRLNMPELVHGRVFSGKSGVGRITWDFIYSMWAELSDDTLNLKPRFEDITLELVSAAINECLGLPANISRSGTIRLLEVKAFINTNLTDPGLYVESISQALKISPRYLHLLFQKEQTTLAGYIRDLRLEKCARDLSDRHLGHRSITEIAYSWGFNSHANFSKLFRKRYNMSARDYRRCMRDK